MMQELSRRLRLANEHDIFKSSLQCWVKTQPTTIYMFSGYLKIRFYFHKLNGETIQAAKAAMQIKPIGIKIFQPKRMIWS